MIRIGVDIDDVLAEFHKGYLPFVNAKLGGVGYTIEDMVTYSHAETLGVTYEEAIRLIFDFYATSAFENLEQVEGSHSCLSRLLATGHFSFISITSRPTMLETMTKRWLASNFPKIFQKVFLTNQFSTDPNTLMETKEGVCAAENVKVMIDDAPHHALKIAQSGVTVLLFDRPWNRDVKHPNIFRVHSWQEIYVYLSAMLNGSREQ